MSADRESWPTLDELLREEDELELAGLSETDAYELGMRAVAAATEQRLPVSVGVWRAGRQLFHCGLPGSTADNDAWLRRKGRVVMRFEHSSLYMARLCQDKQVTLAERFGLPASRYAAAGGAVPCACAAPVWWAGSASPGCRSWTTTASWSTSSASCPASVRPRRPRDEAAGSAAQRARRLARRAPRSTPGRASELGCSRMETTSLNRRAVVTSVTVAAMICPLAHLESR